MIKSLILAAGALVALVGCSGKSEHRLKVAASAVPHAEMLEFIQPDLKKEGIDLEIVVTDDYNMPNRALVEKEVDANFFQHVPFMEEQIAQFHYPIVSVADVEVEPLGIYSKKVHSLAELKLKDTVAIPNDPTNEGRALLLLQEKGVIQLDRSDTLKVTVLNIKENPKQLKFLEVDAAMLPRALDDVAAAAINANYALEAGLLPTHDALALESSDSPYANVLTVRKGDENRSDILALKEALTSEKMKTFIEEKYKGAVLPATTKD